MRGVPRVGGRSHISPHGRVRLGDHPCDRDRYAVRVLWQRPELPRRLIDNLPPDCCVEVPCTAHANGITPHPVGSLPPQLASLITTNINVQRLTVEAALTGQAASTSTTPRCSTRTLPPSCHSIRSRKPVDELLAAHGDTRSRRSRPARCRARAEHPPAPPGGGECARSHHARARSRRGCPRRPVRRSPTQPRPETKRSTVSDPIQPWPIVRRGDQGHPVITLQELLRAHGQHIAADGVLRGPATEAAVKAVQTSRGVPADGVAGPETWPPTIVTVRRGSQGDAVGGVQVEIEFRNLSVSLGSRSTASSGRSPSSPCGASSRRSRSRSTGSSGRSPGGPTSAGCSRCRPSASLTNRRDGTHGRTGAEARGKRRTTVRQLQAALKEAGHDQAPIDGHFGPATEAAVRAFQQEKGIAVDGVVGAITWLNIDEDVVFSHPALRPGSDRQRGPARAEAPPARGLRHNGRRRRHLRLGDGGRREGAAAGIRPGRHDGVVGPQTWNAIHSLGD